MFYEWLKRPLLWFLSVPLTVLLKVPEVFKTCQLSCFNWEDVIPNKCLHSGTCMLVKVGGAEDVKLGVAVISLF